VRVLVVEDEVKMAGLLKRGLEEEGYAVDMSGTGHDALWLASENPYDAVVLDIMLPDLNRARSRARSSANENGFVR